jgi:uncharacterized protein (DUF4213/DUF364 family)
MSNYNDTSKLPVCDKHRHEVINHALREEVIPLTVGMKLEQTVEELREALRKIADCYYDDVLTETVKQRSIAVKAIAETEASHD